jgi:lactate permease
MTYLVWSLPSAMVLASIVLGILSPMGAGALGAALTAVVAFSVAPQPLDAAEALRAAGEAGWLAMLVGLVILGGLFFRQAVALRETGYSEVAQSRAARRARCFDACFLIGPFMEAVTGYGVGQVATIAMLQKTGLAPVHVAVMALLSQTMVPWGAMANGTVIGAALADLSPVELGTRSAILTAPLLLGWVVMFWRAARAAGVAAGTAECVEELCWIGGITALLLLCNHAVGPEVAGVTALGSLIALRCCLHERPSAERLRAVTVACAPYVTLVLGLAASRALPSLTHMLEDAATLRPFAAGPPSHPLTHPATWLMLAGCLTILVFKPAAIVRAAGLACRTGYRSVLTILLFLVMAKLMTVSGMAEALGQGVRQALGSAALLAVPVLAGVFGFMTGSGNASNGLLMQTQVSLGHEAHLEIAWIAAIQNTSAAALTMLSPARVAMGCAIAGVPHLERSVYACAWLFGAVALVILVGASGLLLAV